MTTAASIGDQVREWRQRRRVSQLDLALDAGISTRHLSFLETGRARPSRDMLLRLAGQLEVPLRAQNAMLLSAGFAPMFGEGSFEGPELAHARATMNRLLAALDPFPALVVDRHWTMLDANAAIGRLLAGLDAALLEPPVNVLRLTLRPDGLAPRILNFAEWRGHLLDRLRRQIRATADPVLVDLLGELLRYPAPEPPTPAAPVEIAVPLVLATADGPLSLISTTTTFGTPRDVLLSEIALESFLPADAASAAALRSLADAAA